MTEIVKPAITVILNGFCELLIITSNANFNELRKP